MTGADLSGAVLRDARVTADLSRARLDGADLRVARLGADTTNQLMGLVRAVLQGASLEGADLRGADLAGARVEGAAFEGADLTSARLVDLVGEDEATWEGARNLARAPRK